MLTSTSLVAKACPAHPPAFSRQACHPHSWSTNVLAFRHPTTAAMGLACEWAGFHRTMSRNTKKSEVGKQKMGDREHACFRTSAGMCSENLNEGALDGVNDGCGREGGVTETIC